MTAETVMDKTRLAAFADGELSPEEAAEVVLHLADHPPDQAYVDNVMAANEALSQAFAAPLGDPAPQAIENTILGAKQTAEIVRFPMRPSVWVGAALAAALALAVFTGPSFFTPAQPPRLAVGPISGGSSLSEALNSLPSGVPWAQDADQELLILATLPIAEGFCREFEVIDHADARIDLGIACRTSDTWMVEVTLSEPLASSGTEDGFVTASGAEMQGLLPFLDRLGAGAALAPDDEAALIARGWSH
ncbi:zf-HC2 domain-containing protein [Ruegeria sp. 2205SS24-7]|uniref:anti-sigma factor family protein n=1 Tax=Ruegeria discodermiae TaxID=3064389 RepID=UPI0027406BED|nr:zf-HC2 domain-containing protein [Ruegeria sp. 2205SS24-7]MDP5217295.1 zf-HC2 domain-containing protein [Ruegeria sp. 2205SS24-7]